MEAWVERALAKWPNVPALYGWLSLDRRGRWQIRGEMITRPQIIETISANYAADESGNWYFQNGPQRGYVELAYAPYVALAQPDGSLLAHTGEALGRVDAVWMDEEGSLLLHAALGPALLADGDLDWAMQGLRADGAAVDEPQLAAALELPSGARTALVLHIDGAALPVTRLDYAAMPAALGFIRIPVPADARAARR